jgi:hypothetical protein
MAIAGAPLVRGMFVIVVAPGRTLGLPIVDKSILV